MIKIYTIDEVALELKIHPDTARKLARSGRLSGSKIGQHWRFTEEDLKNFLEQQRPAKGNSHEC